MMQRSSNFVKRRQKRSQYIHTSNIPPMNMILAWIVFLFIKPHVRTQRPTHFPLKATKYILETTQLQRESDTYLPFQTHIVISDTSYLGTSAARTPAPKQYLQLLRLWIVLDISGPRDDIFREYCVLIGRRYSTSWGLGIKGSRSIKKLGRWWKDNCIDLDLILYKDPKPEKNIWLGWALSLGLSCILYCTWHWRMEECSMWDRAGWNGTFRLHWVNNCIMSLTFILAC